MMINEPIFYLWSALGLLAFFYNCFHFWPDWDFRAFLKRKGNTLVRAALITLVCAYLTPASIGYLAEQLHLEDTLAKYPDLAKRVVYMAGMGLGYTGGAVFYMVLEWASKLPGIGPFIKQWLERRKSRKLQTTSPAP